MIRAKFDRRAFSLLAALLPVVPGMPANAANITVSIAAPYVNVDGRCSLVEAMENAEFDTQAHVDCPAGSGPDVIRLGVTVALDGSTLFFPSNPVFFNYGAAGLPEINSAITIRGGKIVRSGDTDLRFFAVGTSGDLTLVDTILDNGRVAGSCNISGSFAGCGGAIVVAGGSLRLDGTRLLNNRAVETMGADFPMGGAIAMLFGSLTARGALLADNAAEYGGAILMRGGSATISASALENNVATQSGGAIMHLSNGTLVTIDSDFSGNAAQGPPGSPNVGGGAIDNAGSSSQLIVSNSDFVNNSAGHGGALRNFNASQAFVSNSRFNGNRAGTGGAIYNAGSGATVRLYDSLVEGNFATTPGSGDGGGIANGGTQTGILALVNSVVRGNAAGGDGGGISSLGQLNLDASVVSDNEGARGGGVYVDSGSAQIVEIRKSSIAGNFASSSGGGLYYTINPGSTVLNSLLVEDSSFDDNQGDEGGGLYAEFTDVTIRRSAITNNRATQTGFGGGGGIHLRSFIAGGMETTLDNVTISGNSANQDGGGVYVNGSAITSAISSATIANNSASSTNGGDGIHNVAPITAVTVRNSILGNNGNRNCLNLSVFGVTDLGNNISSDTTCGFANTGGLGVGDGVNPLLAALADNGGASETHALLFGSAATNSGDGVCAPTDQRLASRVGTCDIGAYERLPAVAQLSLSVDEPVLDEELGTVATATLTLDNAHIGSAAVNVLVPVRVTGNATGLGVDYVLDIQDGLADSEPGRVAMVPIAAAANSIVHETFTLTAVDDDQVEAVENVSIEASIIGPAIFAGENSLQLDIVSGDEAPWVVEDCFVVRLAGSRLLIPCL